MDLTAYLLLMLSLGFTAAFLAERRGRDYRAWFLLGALLGFVALFIILREPQAPTEPDDA